MHGQDHGGDLLIESHGELGDCCEFVLKLGFGGEVFEVIDVLFVTVDYQDGTSFLLCRTYRRMLPLGLCQYLEDRYVFTLGPQSFSLAPFPEGAPTPVPLLLFPS